MDWKSPEGAAWPKPPASVIRNGPPGAGPVRRTVQPRYRLHEMAWTQANLGGTA